MKPFLAMTPTATSSDDDQDLKQEVKRILTLQKTQLLTEWKKMDSSGFEPAAKLDLQAAVINQLYIRKATSDKTSQQRRDSETLPEQTEHSLQDHPPREISSRLLPSGGLTASTQPYEHTQAQFAEMNRNFARHADQIEQLERTSRSLNLILYNVPETEPDAKGRSDSFQGCIDDTFCSPVLQELFFTEDRFDCTDFPHLERVGRLFPGKQKARPMRIVFRSADVKHVFLSNTIAIRQSGVRIDDDLTRLQQQERQTLDSDFRQLKAKGYKPFFRGSQLKYHCNNVLSTCNRGQSSKVLLATEV